MENFNLSFPIDMVKKEERIVSGIATADNIDKSNDIVDFTASVDAFKNWGGNIREMHAPIAVGKAVSYEPIKITGADGQEYNAIRVAAYISKGAQDTWEKVLDGTLKAFSIGGKIIQKAEMTEKLHNGRPINVIKKYILGELSLVDNPANALACVDIIKMDIDGNLDYILNTEKADGQPLKDPKGGLTAAGRRHFKQTEGANLKPGVRGAADTPEKMRRKGSFLTRFFTNPSGPMKDEKGRPTRLALSAAAWGEPVPQDRSDAAALAAKGRRMLERYAATKKKSIDDLIQEDDSILNKEMEYFLSEDYETLLKEGEVATGTMGAGIVNPTQGLPPSTMKPKKKKKKKETEKMEEINSFIKTQGNELQNDINYDKVLDMNEQEVNKLSLLKKMVNWLVPDVQEEASTDVEVTINTQEEEIMDIEILKDALSTVVDDKLANFATSIKEEVEASLNEKIDTITKGFEANTLELQEKLEAAEKALAETEEQVTKFANAGAIKKSVDPEEEEGEDLVKSASNSVWGNLYLPQALISALGYES